MKKYLSKFFQNEYKFLFKTLNYSTKSKFKIDSLNLKLKTNTHLGKKQEKLVLPLDEIITPKIFNEAKWDYYIVEFIKKNIRSKDNHFIDIGANIGLITRQLQYLDLEIKKYFCFEPEVNTFNILKKNLKNSNAYLFNFGLSNKARKTKLFMSDSNKSDNSFYFNKNRNSQSSIVSFKNANRVLSQIIKKNKINNIIYKSDTQGMDEEIFLNLNKSILDKTYLLIMEVSNFDLISKKKNLFLKKLKIFKNFFSENGLKISLYDIEILIKKGKEFNILAKK